MWQSEVTNNIVDDQEYYSVKREWLCIDRLVHLIESGRSEDRKPFLSQYRSRLETLTKLVNDYDAWRCKGRIGKWIPTYTGKRFWLLDPRTEDIDIRDIAHNLARFNRYCGATDGRGYSVAQHSVLCSYQGETHKLAKLLHDATEAYHGDAISPFKDIIRDVYDPIEHRIMLVIAERFGFAWDECVEKEVKKADMALLTTEVRDLVPCGIVNGRLLEPPLKDTIIPWNEDDSERRFLARFEELYERPTVPSVQATAHAA